MTAATPRAVLGPEGSLARLLPGYESRPQQLAMSDLVAEALRAGEHAIVEAPTGVGKSFAYLVPAIHHALERQQKVVISTGTIALQEQLIGKDLPLLEQLFPELNAVLVKGRQNYLSLRRLGRAVTAQQMLFPEASQQDELQALARWAAATETGELGDLGYRPDPVVWRAAVSDANNCRGRRCPRYADCFFYAARRQLEDADLLIVNHHLYFADLALRDEHSSILPPHQVVIFDEAHSLEDIATNHLGLSLSDAQLRYFFDGLHSARGKGLLSSAEHAAAQQAVLLTRQASESFWQEVGAAAGNRAGEVLPITVPDRFQDPLSPALQQLGKVLRQAAGRCDEDNEAQELRAQADRADAFCGQIRTLNGQLIEDYVYYVNLPRERGSISLTANPLSVAEPLRERLFKKTRSVILTSATLAADDSERFLFLRRRIGLEDGKALRLDSPFDYSKQARLLLNRSTLDPNTPRFERALAQWLGDFLDEAPGGTFVLFTSYRQLQSVHDLVRPRLDRAGRFVLRHGDRMGRSQMLDLFKSTGNAVLFGTATFWEGVDVPGEALQNVIITKIPFEVPAHPLIEARHQAIKRAGGNPFMERSVPEAILRLKQGVGRLIRTATDHGTLVICDHRILTRQYGSYFLRALPPMPTEHFSLDDAL